MLSLGGGQSLPYNDGWLPSGAPGERMTMGNLKGMLRVGILVMLAAACAPPAPAPSSAPGGGAAASPVASPAPARASESRDTVQTFDDMGRDHIAPGAPVPAYNSNPPTSGPHSPRFVDWGIVDQLPPKEVMVHNMEHGGVIVWYNCQGGPQPMTPAQCQELRTNLSAVVQPRLAARKEIVMGAYADMQQRIALTAWGKLDAFDDFDAQRVARFIDTYERAFNPEGF